MAWWGRGEAGAVARARSCCVPVFETGTTSFCAGAAFQFVCCAGKRSSKGASSEKKPLAGAGLAFIGFPPTPGPGAETTGDNALAVDVGHGIAIASEKSLGGAHLGAKGQLAL